MEYELPEPIDASPEEVADVVMRAKPPKEWKYLKEPRQREGEER